MQGLTFRPKNASGSNGISSQMILSERTPTPGPSVHFSLTATIISGSENFAHDVPLPEQQLHRHHSQFHRCGQHYSPGTWAFRSGPGYFDPTSERFPHLEDYPDGFNDMKRAPPRLILRDLLERTRAAQNPDWASLTDIAVARDRFPCLCGAWLSSSDELSLHYNAHHSDAFSAPGRPQYRIFDVAERETADGDWLTFPDLAEALDILDVNDEMVDPFAQFASSSGPRAGVVQTPRSIHAGAVQVW